MARRQRLSEPQIAELFDPPTEPRELIRHYTLSETDLAAIARCRGDHNRLGHALMRCYLRYPGRALRVGERPPARDLAVTPVASIPITACDQASRSTLTSRVAMGRISPS